MSISKFLNNDKFSLVYFIVFVLFTTLNMIVTDIPNKDFDFWFWFRLIVMAIIGIPGIIWYGYKVYKKQKK